MRNENERPVEEFCCGKVVARRRQGRGENPCQGLGIGFYDEEGEFNVMVVVEEDRMERGESQMKALVWEDDGDRDPDEYVRWVGPEPCEPPALQAPEGEAEPEGELERRRVEALEAIAYELNAIRSWGIPKR